jgi:hypothetical protein
VVDNSAGPRPNPPAKSQPLLTRKRIGYSAVALGSFALLATMGMAWSWSWDLPQGLRELAYAWREMDSTPLSVFGVVLLVLGFFLVVNPVEAAERATRREMSEDASTLGAVHFHDRMHGDVYLNYPENFNPAQLLLAQQLRESSTGLRRQEAILREIYTQGLVQARLSFYISMIFAAAGGIALLSGVALAVFRAPSHGQQYATIVAALSGTVVSLISALFFAQANATRKNMGNQAVMLREESQDDRRINTSRELIVSVTDEATRNQLQAEVARELIKTLAFEHSATRGSSAAGPLDESTSQ